MEDEDQHAGDQRQHHARQRAERQLGAPVHAVPRSRLFETEPGSSYRSGTHSDPTILLALLLFVTHLMNFVAPPEGAPRVTK